MKISSTQPDRRSLSRSKAWVCAVINQLAFPGMGTVMAGRRTGYVQAALMVVGFLLTMGFMFVYFAALIQCMVQGVGSDSLYKELFHRYGWAGLSGLALCFIAWCWSLVSSILIVRNSPPSA